MCFLGSGSASGIPQSTNLTQYANLLLLAMSMCSLLAMRLDLHLHVKITIGYTRFAQTYPNQVQS